MAGYPRVNRRVIDNVSTRLVVTLCRMGDEDQFQEGIG